MFDRQKFILVSTKYIAYVINIVIIAAVAFGVYMWIDMLIQSAK
jgi:hypothetical protein